MSTATEMVNNIPNWRTIAKSVDEVKKRLIQIGDECTRMAIDATDKEAAAAVIEKARAAFRSEQDKIVKIMSAMDAQVEWENYNGLASEERAVHVKHIQNMVKITENSINQIEKYTQTKFE